MTNDIITMIANLALALSFVVGLIFGIVQVRTAARDRRERLTLETLRNFQTREFAEMIHQINRFNIPPTEKQFRALPSHEQVILLQFAQQMESLGILVAQKLISINLVDITLGSLVINMWEKYKKSFTDIRHNSDPFLGEYFQWLAEQLDKRMKENPRKPFYETDAEAKEMKI